MGRGRSSTNYSDEEKKRLLRFVATVLPRRQAGWKVLADRYNANRPSGLTARDAPSLKRKFKTLSTAKTPTDGTFEDPFVTQAKQILERIRDRSVEGGGAEEIEEDEDAGGEEEDGEEEEEGGGGGGAHEQSSTIGAAALNAMAGASTIPTFQIPLSAANRQLLQATSMPLFQPYSLPMAPQTPVLDATGAPPAKRPRTDGTSDLVQLLVVLREENAQREAARKQEREEALAREERLREEAREQRRQERDETAAREERYWREMAEQRRLDREDAASRHEQMMVILAALLKPGAATVADAASTI